MDTCIPKYIRAHSYKNKTLKTTLNACHLKPRENLVADTDIKLLEQHLKVVILYVK